MKYFINSFGCNRHYETYTNTIFYKSFNNENTFIKKADALKSFNKTKIENKTISFDPKYFYFVITILFDENNNIIKYSCYDLNNNKYVKDFNINTIKINIEL